MNAPHTSQRSPGVPLASPSRRVLGLPLLAAGVLACFAALPSVNRYAAQPQTILIAAAILALGAGVLWLFSSRRTLSARFVVRPAHVIQPFCHAAVYVYWGLYWPPLRDHAPFLFAQIAFAYAFDMLLAWSLGEEYEMGFGPFPIVFSTNLFLWFRPEWFALQLLMIAIGFAAKRLIRWQRDGHRGHIFNPSSFPLFLASVFFLLFGGGTQLSAGSDIANSIGSLPHMHLWLFLVALPVQLYFGVGLMSLAALASCFAVCQLYLLATGVALFIGPIAPAVLLGMLLLFTDPSTSPRHELGRVIFGVLYGAGVALTYVALAAVGQPTFYDKLLVVPILNLGVRAIDRLVEHPAIARFELSKLLPHLRGKARNALFTGAWALVFALVFASRGLGETNEMAKLPYWIDACTKHLYGACYNARLLEADRCEGGSGWACNEYAARMLDADQKNSMVEAATSLGRACELGFQAGCANLLLLRRGVRSMQRSPPGAEEYVHLIDNTGLPKTRTGIQELQWACEQGWPDACETLQRYGVPLRARP